MKNIVKEITVESTTQIEFIDITSEVVTAIESSGIRDGSVLVYAPHTTMSISINHAESMLMQDFMRMLYRIVPVDDQYSHDLFELRRDHKSDGRSNGHSHCKALLLGTSETIPIVKGKMILTELQSIFAVDFDGARERNIFIQTTGK